jgi:hypothetical protein
MGEKGSLIEVYYPVEGDDGEEIDLAEAGEVK